MVTILSWQQSDKYAWAANHQNIFEFNQWWKIFTSVLIHSDPQHWLSNSILLVVFGWLLAGYFGFFLFPMICLVLAWMTHVLTLWTYPLEVYLIGASGLVYVMAGVWLSLYFLISRDRLWRSRLIRVLGVCLSLLLPTQFQPEVSYRAHLFGFLIGVLGGVIYFIFNYKKIQRYDAWEEIIESEAEDIF